MTSYLVADPYQLKFTQWGALVAEQLAQQGVDVPPPDESSWRAWAGELTGLPELSARNIPDPSLYQDWKDWGQIFVEALR